MADVVWCLGLGCLLAVLRDLLGLILGNGPVRCFLWDLVAFGAAAVLVCGFAAGVSATGLARWYMSGAVLAGVLAWNGTVRPAVHRLLGGVIRTLLWPLRWFSEKWLHPWRLWIATKWHRAGARSHDKNVRKKAKNGKKQLQKASKIVYN